jgi:predicted O-methyltransferase YrrM
VEEVIRPGGPAALCAPVEEIRKRYLAGSEVILKTDFGLGGSSQHKYTVRLSRLARSSSSPAYRAARLFRMVKFTGAGTIIELGTALGISSAYMGKARPEARIFTLEGCPELAEHARKNFTELGLVNISVVEGNFNETLPGVLDHIEKVDLVFFDGNHQHKATMHYYELCKAKAVDESVFIFDDIHHSPVMERAWDEIKRDPGIRVSLDVFHMGIVLFRKGLSRQHFILRYP